MITLSDLVVSASSALLFAMLNSTQQTLDSHTPSLLNGFQEAKRNAEDAETPRTQRFNQQLAIVDDEEEERAATEGRPTNDGGDLY